MKRFLVYLFTCLWVWAPLAHLRAIPLHVFLSGGTASTGGVTYIINEDFEGTGKPAGWTDGGTPPGWDNTTDAIDGQSPSFSSTAANAYFAITDGTYFVAILQFRMPSAQGLPASTRTIMSFREDTLTDHCSAKVTTTGQIRLSTNGSDVSSVDVMSLDTNYYIKLIYNEGGSSSVEFSTTTTFLGSGNKYRSATSASSVNTNRFYIGYPSNSIIGYRVDNVKLAATDFSL